MSSRKRLQQWLDAQDLWEDGEPRPRQVSPPLERHFADFVGQAGAASVLVPLCGRSFDLCWLSEQGLQVVGVESSRRVIARFAAEQGLELAVGDQSPEAPLTPWHAGACTVFEGDFFDATPETLGGELDLAYDCGALSAVDPARRAEYAAVLLRLLGARGRALLVAPEFQGGPEPPEPPGRPEPPGPALAALGPHSLGLEELRGLFGGCALEVLGEERAPPSGRYSRLASAGVASVLERVVLCTRGRPPGPAR